MASKRDWRDNRFSRWTNSPKVAGWFVLLAAIGCFVGLWVSRDAATALRDHGVRATAEVIEVHTAGKDSTVVVRFTDQRGEAVEATVGNYRFQPEPQVGDQPQVLYDPEDPEGNVADVRMGPDFVVPWFLGACGVIAAVLVWPTFTGRLDWNKLR